MKLIRTAKGVTIEFDWEEAKDLFVFLYCNPTKREGVVNYAFLELEELFGENNE